MYSIIFFIMVWLFALVSITSNRLYFQLFNSNPLVLCPDPTHERRGSGEIARNTICLQPEILGYIMISMMTKHFFGM